MFEAEQIVDQRRTRGASRMRRIGTTLAGAGAGLALAGVLAAGLAGGMRAPAAMAQETQVPATAGISVIGQGEVRAKPDVITARLGIEVTAAAPADALNQTRQRADQVIARLRERGIPEADIQTSNLNVFPVQAPPRDPTAPPAITGYRGSATVTALLPDVSQASALLTAAIEAGANSVQGLSYGLRDEAPLRTQALQAAITQARPKAEAAASAAGLRVTGVRAVQEFAGGVPIPLGGGRGGAGGGEGIAPGELTVAVMAQVTFDVTRA
jgi:uncharacterized protein YggE